MPHIRVLMVVLMLASMPAQASNSWVANCENLKDPAKQAQIGVCTNHPGCKLFLESQRDCAAAGGFLDKLMAVTSGRQVITSSDVFEAVLPHVANDPEITRASQAIKSRFDKQTGIVITTGVTEDVKTDWIFKGPWVYEGPMVNGKRHGVGIIIDGGNRLFRGEFVAGHQAGHGELINTNKSVRELGNRNNFHLNGHGILWNPSRRIIGQFKDDRAHGRATYVSVNGGRYDGEYVSGKKHGRGVEIYANGHRYEGTHADGRRHGQGTYTFPNGARYQGGFANGNYHGQGTHTFPNGGRYVGSYVDDKQHGQGAETYPNGNRYTGEFASGKRHGQGTFTFTNGIRYVGSFVDGNPFNGRETDTNEKVIAVYVDGNKQTSDTDPDRAALRAEMERRRAEQAARQEAVAEQERKEARRRERQEAMGVLRSYADTSAAMGNRKPTRQLAAVEILAGNSPQEILSILKTALAEATVRNPSLARKLATLNSLQDVTAQDVLAILRPILTDAASRNPNVAKKLAILEVLTASAPQEAMDILKPMLADAASRRLMR